MHIARTRGELAAALADARGRVGFVPTMGNLHAGHVKLIETAREHADFVVASIFVNPLQFGPSEDFRSYPRTFDADVGELCAAECDLLFAPSVQEMYPSGPDAAPQVAPPSALADILEGAHRPGHFAGVATVVKRLFELVPAHVAVFGEKDFQQLLVIRWLVEHYALPIGIVGEATVREPDGLAMSSRNRYLTPDERARAPAIYGTLSAAAAAVRAGERDWTAISARGMSALSDAGMAPDYFEVRCADDLSEPADGDPLVVLTAARLGRARLIDNLRV